MTQEKGKKMTIDELAIIMARSFATMEQNFNRKIDNIEEKMATKEDIKTIIERLDIIENRVNNNQEARISHLEDDVRFLKTKFDQ